MSQRARKIGHHKEKIASKIWQAHRLEGKVKNLGIKKKKKQRKSARTRS